MFLMIKQLAEPEHIEVADIKLGYHCMEIYPYGAPIEVPSYDEDEDENLDLASCARVHYVPEAARALAEVLHDAAGRIDHEGEE
jgi:hypothetical protein